MKYELMRAYYCKQRDYFVLDLFNLHENKGVELHYYIGGYRKTKYDIESIIPILDIERKSRKMHNIEYWDDLIKIREGFEENDFEA